MRKLRQNAPVESLLAILQILGARIDGMDDVDNALDERERELWDRVVDPVVVAWNGKIPPIRIRTTELNRRSLRYTVIVEGHVEDRTVAAPLSKLATKDRCEIGGARYVERELKIDRQLAPGYHRIRFELGRHTCETLLISAPVKAYFPFDHREWGVFAPVYSLHSRRNPHAGDISDFESLLNWAGEAGGHVGGTLPLLAAFLDEPFEPSPYTPASRLFWNEFYAELRHAAGARAGSPGGLVDYRDEAKFRRSVLEKEAAEFFSGSRSEIHNRFDRFVREENELERYSCFRAVTQRLRAGWSSWPARLRDGEIRAGDYDARVMRYHMYAQWRIQEQLRSLGTKTRDKGQLLYLDLPLGLHPHSYDIWRFRDFFALQADGGAPPDPVFTKGQNWGFPPMHPDSMRLRHHQYTIAYIRNHLRYARMLRIDHVMGLHRLFWIPNGFTGDKGVYVDYPAAELYAILCLESHRNLAGIVGENLGTVPPEVNVAMRRHNIHQMYVLQYEVVGSDPKSALRSVPANAVASLNTHDMPPFRAFLEGTDIDDRLDLRFLDEASAKKERRDRATIRKLLVQFLEHKKLMRRGKRGDLAEIFKGAARFLASSQASVVLVNLEDLWGETLPQNVPATQHERPNWRRRMKLSLEEMRESKQIRGTLQQIDEERGMKA